MREVLKAFAAVLAVSLFCSLLVTSAAVLLEERQERNLRLDKIRHLLEVAGVEAQATKPALQCSTYLIAQRFR